MIVNPESISNSDMNSDDELLTSYLDDELDDEQRIEVESRLANDDELRTNLHRLQRTWDILDQLPQAELKNSFTQSTLEMVVADAKKQTRQKLASYWEWPLRIAAIVGAPLAMFFLSSMAVRFWQDSPNRELIENLPIIDNVDVYLKAESIEFLTQLRDTGLFDESDEIADNTDK